MSQSQEDVLCPEDQLAADLIIAKIQRNEAQHRTRVLWRLVIFLMMILVLAIPTASYYICTLLQENTIQLELLREIKSEGGTGFKV